MSKAHLVSVTKTSPYGCASTLVFYINFQILNVTLSLSKGKPNRHAKLNSASHPTIINCLLSTEHRQFLSLSKDQLPQKTPILYKEGCPIGRGGCQSVYALTSIFYTLKVTLSPSKETFPTFTIYSIHATIYNLTTAY